jgi:hypothetical protein
LRRIVDLLYPVQLESERLISAKPAMAAEFEQGRLQLYCHAKREGWLVEERNEGTKTGPKKFQEVSQ